MKPWPMLKSHFSYQTRSFQEWQILCETKYCLISVMCRAVPLSQYQLSAFTLFALEAPFTCPRNATAFFFAADLPTLSPACCCFWGHSAA